MKPSHNCSDDIVDIITYLGENPLDLIYDPEDDECADLFGLERFMLVEYDTKRVGAG